MYGRLTATEIRLVGLGGMPVRDCRLYIEN